MKPFLQTAIVLFLLACYVPVNAQGINGEVLAAADADTKQEQEGDKKKDGKKKDGKQTEDSEEEEPDCD